MADILEFPSRQAQGLAFLDRELRALLAARGADERLINFAVSQLTRTYAQLSESEQYSFSVALPDSIDTAAKDALYQQINAGLEGIRKENHALMVQLIARLVFAELRLFAHERTE